MSEDCQKCGTAMHELDDDQLCPACGNHDVEETTMTNNPTIDGVSREDLDLVLTYGCGTDASDEAWNRLHALLDAPVVERRPVCATCNGTRVVDDGELTHSGGGIPYENGPIKCVKDCPDCQGSTKLAALQSTITQLQARIAELESGSGEPVYQLRNLDNGSGWRDADKAAFDSVEQLCGRYERRTLFTDPPAPVAVVLPERINHTWPGSADIGWNACLDATAALNEKSTNEVTK